jgi:hypothetical protein
MATLLFFSAKIKFLLPLPWPEQENNISAIEEYNKILIIAFIKISVSNNEWLRGSIRKTLPRPGEKFPTPQAGACS